MPLTSLPLPDPGSPDLSSPLAFLRWLQRSQRRGQVLSTCWALVEMGCQAALPLPLGRGVQAAVDGDPAGIWQAGAFALALAVVASVGTVLLHRQAVWNWITAATQVRQLVARQASRLGAGLSRRIATGEVVAVGSGDVEKIGWYVELVARVRAAVLVWLAVSITVLTVQPLLGLVVLLGVPVLAASVWPLLGPFEERYSEQRTLGGKATELAADTVAGLRVLRGIGGEELFLARYRAASQKVRAAAVRATRLWALMQAQQVLLPGLFVVGVTWYGAHLAATGAIGIGTLVSVYGATAFLAAPLRILGEAAHAWSVARVSAGRATRVLALTRTNGEPDAVLGHPERADLHDPVTGLTARAGELTAVVCGDPDFAGTLAERLGGHVPQAEEDGPDAPQATAAQPPRYGSAAFRWTPCRWPRRAPPSWSTTRSRCCSPARWRSCSTCPPPGGSGRRTHWPPPAPRTSWTPWWTAPRTAAATRCWPGSPNAAARSPAASASAWPWPARSSPTRRSSSWTSRPARSTPTESRIAAGLRRNRAGRTTVVLATSPLLLDQADRVVLVREGRAVAAGTHRELMQGDPHYRAVVTREEPVDATPRTPVKEAV